MFAQGFLVYGDIPFCLVIGAQLLRPSEFPDLGNGRYDSGKFGKYGFNFAQFNPVSPQFNLGVNAAQVFYEPVTAPANQVTGTVEFLVAWPCAVRIGQEPFCRQLFPLPITHGNLRSGQTQLTGYSCREQLLYVIHYIRPGIGDWPSNGNIFCIFLLVNYVIIRAYCKFSGPIPVNNLQVPFLYGKHFLPPNQNVFHGKFKLIDHFQPELCADGASCDVVGKDVIVEHYHVLAHLGGNDVYAGTCGQRRKDIVYRGIKAEAGMAEVVIPKDDIHIVRMADAPGCQTPVADHHPFGLPGGTRGIDHVSQVPGSWQAGDF